MTGTVYAYADVGRTGLGNMLFPWARAEVFAHRHGIRMLAPQWTKPKIGPMLRGERDKRLYVGLFSNSGYVRGARRWLALSRGTRIDEAEGDALIRSGPGGGGTTVVQFKGFEWWFEGTGPHQRLVPHRELVCRRLREILAGPIRRRLEEQSGEVVIAAHIRRGDKPTMAYLQPYGGVIDGVPQHHQTMSDQWFINTIGQVREAVGREAPVTVFSDARDEQIAPILALPKVTRAPDNPSIVDILLLARARALITTGTSSFSAWASYVGGMPTLWYPGLRLDLIEGRPELAIETDLTGALPPGAAAVLKAAGSPTAA